MKRWRKMLVILGGTAVGLGLVAGVLPGVIANLPVVRHRLEAALSDALEMPVRVQAVAYSPVSGLELSGVVVPGDPGDWFHAGRIVVRARLLPLLGRRVVIDEVRIEAPSLDWRQDEGGRFLLPRMERAVRAEPVQPGVDKAPSAPEAPGLAVELRRVNLENGSLILRDPDGEPIVELVGATMRASTGASVKTFAGVVEAADLRFGRMPPGAPPAVERVRIPFVYTGEGLELQGIDAAVVGGTLRGSLLVALQTSEQHLQFRMQMDHVAFAPLLAAFGENESALTGRLKGTAEFSGDLARTESRRGTLTLQLDEARVNQHPLLQTAGVLLGMPELIRVDLQTATLNATMRGAQTVVDSLTLAGDSIRMDATGTVDEHGALDLKAALGVRDDVLKKIPSEVRSNFNADSAREGWSRVPFKISGTLEKPKSDLERVLTGGSLESLILNTLGLGEDQ